jgi:hypothetical protein
LLIIADVIEAINPPYCALGDKYLATATLRSTRSPVQKCFIRRNILDNGSKFIDSGFIAITDNGLIDLRGAKLFSAMEYQTCEGRLLLSIEKIINARETPKKITSYSSFTEAQKPTPNTTFIHLDTIAAALTKRHKYTKTDAILAMTSKVMEVSEALQCGCGEILEWAKYTTR